MKILVIGGGNMGLTYAKSISQNSKFATISILEKQPAKIEELRNTTSFTIYNEAKECVNNVEVILLAIKPQIASLVLEQISSLVNKDQIIISIMAGVTLETITEALQIPKVVRAMPNLPAQVGYGVTGYYPATAVANKDLTAVETILKATGTITKVETEDQIDAITALSGSGPAYVFYLMNAMMQQAEEFGFSNKAAKEIALGTFLGTAQLFKDSDVKATTWVDRVTSKGGTTHAALVSFKKNDLDNCFKEGIQAAYNRAKELAKG